MNLSDPKDRRDAILGRLRAALYQSCADMVLFSEEFDRTLDAEYLLPVNAAKQIITLNSGLGFPLKIYLEENAEGFAAKCIPEFAYMGAGIRRKLIRRERSVSTPNRDNFRGDGRVDIAVMRDGSHFLIPVCVIEVKSFRPQKERVVLDLVRNASFFGVSGNTGSSQIEFTAVATLHDFPKTAHVREQANDLEVVNGKCTEWLTEVTIPDGITVPGRVPGEPVPIR